MKKFKIISLVMVLLLSISLLAGCGKESVTVDDLLTSYTNTISSDVSYDLNMLLKAEADMSELGNSGTMEIGIDMNSKVKTDQSNAYMNIDASMSMFGMNIPVTAEVYAIKDGNTIKTYTLSEDAWNYSEDTESTIPMAVAAEELKKVNWELTSTKDGYTLTGKIDMSKIDMSLSDMDISEMTGDIGEVPVTMEFNKNKEIQKVSFDLNGIKSDEMTIKEAVFEMTNFKTDKVEIELPEEAKEAEMKIASGEDFLSGMNLEEEETLPSVSEVEEPQSVVEEPKEEPASEVTSSTVEGSWMEMKGNIDNLNFAIPFKVKDLINDGWKFEDNRYASGYTLNSMDMTSGTITLVKDGTDGMLWIGVRNTSNSAVDILDGEVWSLSYDAFLAKNPVKEFKISGGAKLGMSMADVKAIYGEPQDTYIGDGYASLTYGSSWEDGYDGKTVDFTFSDDALVEIELQQWN